MTTSALTLINSGGDFSRSAHQYGVMTTFALSTPTYGVVSATLRVLTARFQSALNPRWIFPSRGTFVVIAQLA